MSALSNYDIFATKEKLLDTDALESSNQFRTAEGLDARRIAVMRLMAKGEVTGEDVTHLSRWVFGNATLNRDEADALFALERSQISKCSEWTDFFVNAMTDHVVWDVRPTGVVNEAQGEWLIGQVDKTPTLPAFATLINVMAEAHRVPLWFAAAVRGRAAKASSEGALAHAFQRLEVSPTKIKPMMKAA